MRAAIYARILVTLYCLLAGTALGQYGRWFAAGPVRGEFTLIIRAERW